MIKAAVVGYGSIGVRHANCLKELGCHVAVISRHHSDDDSLFTSLGECLKNFNPDYVVIANDTRSHFDSFKTLADTSFRGKVLIEKPLFANRVTIPKHSITYIYTAYNLRFHPILQKLKMILAASKNIIQVQAYVGKHISTWRPDGRLGYSATRAGGGGVLRDLSHELDYLNWLLGGWQALTAVGGRFSDNTLDSDDAYSLLLKTRRCPLVSLQMNYLDRKSRREIIIQTDNQTFKADLVQNTLETDDQIEQYPMDKNHTYLRQHEAVLSGNTESLCSFEEGIDVVKMIEAAEEAAKDFKWIHR
ncbi:MAG: Gfo/Idh/MocA family oxidoreductase [Candidatus Omnitrophica bacterium]|nr:Gfo/Idh/MocA family oxidoreductase [Candidatus Omnitrophota bacterium]